MLLHCAQVSPWGLPLLAAFLTFLSNLIVNVVSKLCVSPDLPGLAALREEKLSARNSRRAMKGVLCSLGFFKSFSCDSSLPTTNRRCSYMLQLQWALGKKRDGGWCISPQRTAQWFWSEKKGKKMRRVGKIRECAGAQIIFLLLAFQWNAWIEKMDFFFFFIFPR